MDDAANNAKPEPQGLAMPPEEQKRRKQRNLAIALSLAGFIILVFTVTVLRLGATAAERSF